MKTETITALSNRGKANEDKVEAECDIPENLQEAIELVGGEEAVFKRFLASYKVELQNKIRKPPAKKITYVLDAFKRMLPLLDSGTLTMEQVRESSQYFGPWPIEEATEAA